MPKAISYGVLIFNEFGQILVAHVTGQAIWDIPKGGANEGESPIQAAVRETFEETGLILSPENLQDFGRHAYLPRKDLHLFSTKVLTDECDISQCSCTSFYANYYTGKLTAEVDDFRWIYPHETPVYCSKRMDALLATIFRLTGAHELMIPATDPGSH
jgi:putative (di)nucleoside polyphosphate hydrolase